MSDDNELFDSLDFGGEIDGAGVTLHEMFQSFMRAGFDETQAFELTRSITVAHVQGSYLN